MDLIKDILIYMTVVYAGLDSSCVIHTASKGIQIENARPDVIGFQEVRIDADGSKNQLEELKELLPEYSWLNVKSANDVQKVKGSYWKGWEREGIGILSKKPLLTSTVQILPYLSGPDTNRRIVLHTSVKVSDEVTINIAVVHFSYDRQQQCGNAAQLLRYIYENELKNVIVVGDFNTYSDFDSPVRLLTEGAPTHESHCSLALITFMKSLHIRLVDAWLSMNATGKGLTFSNMPTPGYESRPDRILVSKNLRVRSITFNGNGSAYKQKFYKHILWHRFWTVVEKARHSFNAISGYSCSQDCGPRGSCRCGLCIHESNMNCNLPKCEECSSLVFYSLLVTLIFGVVLIVFTLLIFLQVLVSAISHQNIPLCLCNYDLLFKRVVSRGKLRSLHKYCPLMQLPPAISLLLCAFSIALLLLAFYTTNYQLFKIVYNIMQEEFYPSDHLLMIAETIV